MASDTLQLRTLDGDEVRLEAGALWALPGGGRRLRPGDPGFEDATRIWNGMIQKTPALVVQPSTTDEVVSTVNFARAHRVLISVKGGGTISPACLSPIRD